MAISLLATLWIVLVNLVAKLMCDVGVTKADASTERQLNMSIVAIGLGSEQFERFNLVAGLLDCVHRSDVE